MSDNASLVALNAGFTVIGLGVVLAVGVPRARAWLPTIVGVAPAAGLATCGLAATLAAMVGIDVRVATVFVIAVAGVTVAALARRAAPSGGSLSPPPFRPVVAVAEAAVLVLLAVLSVGVIRFAAATGLNAWDGWALWAPKAHALYVEGDVWGPVFRDAGYFMQHQEYPVLLPALEALAADALGRFDPTLADIEAAAVLVSFGWAAWAILRLVVSPPVAAAVAFALTGTSRLIDNVGANYADAALASFVALGLLCLVVWLTTDAGVTRGLATLFLASAALTKSEGLVFTLAAIAAALVVARGLGRSPRSVVGFGAHVLALPVLWSVVDRLNGPGAKNVDASVLVDAGELADAAGRIPTATGRLLDEVASGWPVIALAAVAAIAAAFAVRVVWPAVLVGLWSVLSLASLVGIYFLSTNPIDWHLATSADRVVYSVVLGAATVAPVLVALAWERARAGPTVLRSRA